MTSNCITCAGIIANMTRRIGETGGVIAGVGITVEGLGVGWSGDEGVGGEEARCGGEVEAGVIVNQTQLQILFLPREIPIGDGLGGGGAGAAEGVVTGRGAGDFLAGLPAAAISEGRGGAEMVAENVKEAVVCGRWVARDAGSYGLTPQGVGGAFNLGGADHEVVEVGVGGHSAETNLPSAFANADKPVFVGIGLGVDVRVIMLL